MNSKAFWVPEAPAFPGLYANAKDVRREKIEDPNSIAISTRNIHSARQFPTREACETWCIENPVPQFHPVEHEIVDE